MVRRLTICCAVLTTLLLTACAFAQPQFPVNADFSDGTSGWRVPDDCRVADDALSLAGGTAISDASAEPLEGWQQVSLRLKGPGKRSDSSLRVALGPAGTDVAAQVALTAEEAGGGWHTLSAELLPPPGIPASVAISVEGADRWLIESVSVTSIDLSPEPSGDAAVVPEALPADWAPDGLLDAIERPLGHNTELLVSVGALQIGMPDHVEVSRGHRGSAALIVKNRANTARTLTVSVSGPPGFFAPDRTVTILHGRETVFRASLQAFFVGTRWARVTFRSGNDEASAPIRVTASTSYPAPGVGFADGDVPGAMLDALAGASITMVAASPGPTLPEHLTRLRLLSPPWSEDALRSAAAEAAAQADFAALDHPRGDAPETPAGPATVLLREALNEAPGTVSTLGPTVDLLSGPPAKIAADDLASVRELGAAGVISAPTLRLPVLEARPARAVSLDRKPLAAAQPAWTEFSRALAFGAVSAAIRESARLPMFFSDLAARSSGSPEADATMLARTLIACAYQGATGWTVPARAEDAPPGATAFCPFGEGATLDGPVARVYSELSRELAAAVPLGILKQTPEIGSAVDAQVGFRPFMRNDEGILALWNNTGAAVDLIVEVRTQPLDMHTVSVGPDGVRREYLGEFRFSEESITLNRPVIFVTLQPSEVKVLSMQLARAHIGWLASVEHEPRIKRDDSDRPGFLEEWAGERGHR